MSQADQYLMTVIWGDPVLENRFETYPYSLFEHELKMLAAHQQFIQSLWHDLLYTDIVSSKAPNYVTFQCIDPEAICPVLF